MSGFSLDQKIGMLLAKKQQKQKTAIFELFC